MRQLVSAVALFLAACAPPAIVSKPITASVTATGETVAVKSGDDAADDPAIWRNAANPAASLIVGTDKQAGLYVYGLDGQVRHFLDAGRVNNVDVAQTPAGVFVVASDRTDKANAHVALFRLDTTTARLTALGRIPAGPGEAYGLCLWQSNNVLTAFLVMKNGRISQVEIDTASATGKTVRSMKLATQSEGCVVDPRTARLYVAEEDAGIWRFDARPGASSKPTNVARVDKARLFDDAEGLAIAADGPANGGYLVASSQGDNAYAVWRLSDDRYMGRFRITAGKFGATQETDGIAIDTGNLGPGYEQGLMVAQDGDNQPAQNFKLVGWGKVKAALGLP